ncbi:hypothetical protein SGPA1_50721 [Streptomyces misionensis JCM 4497]
MRPATCGRGRRAERPAAMAVLAHAPTVRPARRRPAGRRLCVARLRRRGGRRPGVHPRGPEDRRVQRARRLPSAPRRLLDAQRQRGRAVHLRRRQPDRADRGPGDAAGRRLPAGRRGDLHRAARRDLRRGHRRQLRRPLALCLDLPAARAEGAPGPDDHGHAVRGEVRRRAAQRRVDGRAPEDRARLHHRQEGGRRPPLRGPGHPVHQGQQRLQAHRPDRPVGHRRRVLPRRQAARRARLPRRHLLLLERRPHRTRRHPRRPPPGPGRGRHLLRRRHEAAVQQRGRGQRGGRQGRPRPPRRLPVDGQRLLRHPHEGKQEPASRRGRDRRRAAGPGGSGKTATPRKVTRRCRAGGAVGPSARWHMPKTQATRTAGGQPFPGPYGR